MFSGHRMALPQMDALEVQEGFFYWSQWLQISIKPSFLGNKLKCCINISLDKYCITISSVLLVASQGFGSQAVVGCRQGALGQTL